MVPLIPSLSIACQGWETGCVSMEKPFTAVGPGKFVRTKRKTASSVYYTRREDVLYAILTEWPVDSRVVLDCPIPTAQTTVRLLGFLPGDDQSSLLLGENTTTPPPMLSWSQTASVDHNHVRGGGMEIQLPRLTPDIVPCQHAWTLVLTNLANF
jgi:alpha-L-fucosidase